MSETKTELLKIEPAKSSRSMCRGCQKKINKDTIRVGNPYQFNSPKGDEITGYRWFHLECTPGYVIPDTINSLNENPLADENQQQDTLSILEQMFRNKPKEEPRTQRMDQTPLFERAKSSRGKCRKCEEKIEKGVIRVAEPTMVELDDGRKFPSSKYYHQDCYFEQLEDPKTSIESILKTSLEKQTINDEEAQEVMAGFADLFQSDSKVVDLLALIGPEPIKIQFLKRKALEIGIDFKLVEKAIERGMVQGKYFNPEPDMIQKLS
jgi:hypothetical protein